MDYEERYCRACIHYDPEDGPDCPVWQAQHFWNRQQFTNGALGVMLESFIPREGSTNGQCKMFVEDKRTIVHEMRCLECGTKVSVANA